MNKRRGYSYYYSHDFHPRARDCDKSDDKCSEITKIKRAIHEIVDSKQFESLVKAILG